MVEVGQYNQLKVIREAAFGLYLDDGNEGILLPKRFVPAGAKIGDTLRVFIYHDGEDRIIATTQEPKGIVGDIVNLKAVTTTAQGAYLDFGLMKDLFVPASKQRQPMRPDCFYLVKIYLDEKTNRIAATEKFDHELSNEVLTVFEKQLVRLTVYRRTDIGYVAIINNQHTGLLHFNEIYRNIQVGDQFEGFIKNIYPDDNRIDLAAGKPGYIRVEDETEKISRLLIENEGFLPYHDKTKPEDIYAFFGMSKKTFKMATGNLFKNKRITFEPNGIRLVKKA